MVDGLNGKQFIKIDGTNQQIDLTKLDGIRVGNKNSIFLTGGFDANNDGRISADEFFDLNKDGVISGEKETALLAKYLQKLGGKDENIGKGDFHDTNDINHAKFEALKYIATQQNVRINGGTYEDTTVNGNKFQLHYKEDGSGTLTVNSKDRNNKPVQTVNNYDAEGRLVSVTTTRADGVKSTTTYTEWDSNGKPTKGETLVTSKDGAIVQKQTIDITYNEQGKQTSKTVNTLVPNPKKEGEYVAKQSQKKTWEYDANGNISQVTNIVRKAGTKANPQPTETVTVSKFGENGKVASSTVQSYEGKGDNKVLKNTSNITYAYTDKGVLTNRYIENTDKEGIFTSSIIDTYSADGKTLVTRQQVYQNKGQWYQDYYSGSNLENRLGRLPDVRIKLDGPDGEPQGYIYNQFDKDGVLIGRYETDVEGNEIQGSRQDFSKPNGKIDTAYQIGMGDCYLLAAINALAESETGRARLEDNIVINQGPPTTYTIKFPGAAQARELLTTGGDNFMDLPLAAGGTIDHLPADKVYIQGEYTITQEEYEAACKKAGKSYSAGCKDVLLLEVAYERYRQDAEKTIAANGLDRTKCKFVPGLEVNSNDNKPDLAGGQPGMATYILTGKKPIIYFAGTPAKDLPICYIDSEMQMRVGDEDMKTKFMHLFESLPEEITKAGNAGQSQDANQREIQLNNMISALQKDFEDGDFDNYTATACFMVAPTDELGSNPNGGGHALTIKGFDENGNIILTNPWNPEKDVTMSINEFKQAVYQVNITPLNEQGMTDYNNIVNNNPSGQTSTTGGTSSTPVVAQDPATVQAQFKQHGLDMGRAADRRGLPDGGFKAGEFKAGETYTVREGSSISKMVTAMLIEQGIPVTKENVRLARQMFEKENASKIKSTRKGVKFVLIGAQVKVPIFDKTKFATQ